MAIIRPVDHSVDHSACRSFSLSIFHHKQAAPELCAPILCAPILSGSALCGSAVIPACSLMHRSDAAIHPKAIKPEGDINPEGDRA
jgi:hypothetical protein